ncbi:MAG: ParB/RepB/Spo0J family partition protein [Candidatus Marinimicrobia bacterium]|nr:ParB/RepB/Spo0J family partition protein [Candidatus Neomarinimicrobiota bacterium]MDD5539150.1 ParB/RepB/Spo0J family partition protein [Candidatus Neomarinimicrobiota bacterium]
MTIQEIPVEFIFDNPYNPRTKYEPDKINEMVVSIEENGLLNPPMARKLTPESYEIAQGGYRLRAFKKLAKKDKGKWGSMPLNVQEVTDFQMAVYGLEENLRRRNLTPMETAFAVDKYLTAFPETREEDMAKKLSMTQGTISNMRRVTKLPAKVLKYVDDGTILFTSARELCSISDITGVTKGAVDAELVMVDAISQINTEGIPNTVAGMKKAIHRAVKGMVSNGFFRELVKGMPVANPPVFDTDALACFKCPKSLKTIGEDGKAAYTCMDVVCWDLAQTTAKRKIEEEAEVKRAAAIEEVRAAREAREKEAADKAANPPENIPQEIPEPTTPKPKPRVIYVEPDRLEEKGNIYESYSAIEIFDGKEIHTPFHELGEDYLSTGDYQGIEGAKEAYRIIPRGEYSGAVRTLKSPDGTDQKEWVKPFLEDPFGPYNGVIVKWGDKEFVMVGPKVVFAPSEFTPPPAVPPSAFDKTTEITIGKDEQEPEEETEEEENAETSAMEESPTEINEPAPSQSTEPAPATSIPETEGDKLYTVSLTLSIIVPHDLPDGENPTDWAWKEFLKAFREDRYTSDDITVKPA